jgi:hypothetical protein
MDDLFLDSGAFLHKPSPGYDTWPKVMVIHEQPELVMDIAGKMLRSQLFPFIFTNSTAALASGKAKECVGMVIHKDIPGGITYFLEKLDFPGSDLIRKGVMSGEFFRGVIPERCIRFIKELHIDFGYDTTDRDGIFPEWVARVLKFGLLTPMELELRGTDKGIITSEFQARQREARLEQVRNHHTKESF